jgi:hypothetical protein
MFPEFLRIGYCISTIVANSFRTISLSFKTDLAAFFFLSGIGFDTTIAGLTSAFPFPINRNGKIVSGTQYRLSHPCHRYPSTSSGVSQTAGISNDACFKKQNQKSCGIFRVGCCIFISVARNFITVSFPDKSG